MRKEEEDEEEEEEGVSYFPRRRVLPAGFRELCYSKYIV